MYTHTHSHTHRGYAVGGQGGRTERAFHLQLVQQPQDTWPATLLDEAAIKNICRYYRGGGYSYKHARTRMCAPAYTHKLARTMRRRRSESERELGFGGERARERVFSGHEA